MKSVCIYCWSCAYYLGLSHWQIGPEDKVGTDSSLSFGFILFSRDFTPERNSIRLADVRTPGKMARKRDFPAEHSPFRPRQSCPNSRRLGYTRLTGDPENIIIVWELLLYTLE